jgi:hypothetical protein
MSPDIRHKANHSGPIFELLQALIQPRRVPFQILCNIFMAGIAGMILKFVSTRHREIATNLS